VNPATNPKPALLIKSQLCAPAHEAGHKAPIGLRTVAVFEAAKGVIVLVVGLGLLTLIHRDAQGMAEDMVNRLHLNPARNYPRIFIDAASQLTDARLWFMSLMALVYSGVRFIEAYGLWHELPWAEWFAVISSGIFLPFEIRHLILKPTFGSLLLLLINLGIIIYLASLMTRDARHKKKSHFGG
jgi:uncharacterized membrane protein (DUF2068 family)